MATNREHFEQTDSNADELEALRALVASLALLEGLTGEYEGTIKKIKIVNGVITEIEMEE